MRVFGYEYDRMEAATKGLNFLKKLEIQSAYLHAGACGEKKGQKRIGCHVAINNFVCLAYFDGCFARGPRAWNYFGFYE